MRVKTPPWPAAIVGFMPWGMPYRHAWLGDHSMAPVFQLTTLGQGYWMVNAAHGEQ